MVGCQSKLTHIITFVRAPHAFLMYIPTFLQASLFFPLTFCHGLGVSQEAVFASPFRF